MADESVLRGVIGFFGDLGIYDVVLPFLLVFSIVFAILEKTKVLGMEKIGDAEYTKKNLNAIVAFVIGFLVVASTKLVAVINTALANIVLLLLLVVFFLTLVGAFFKDGEGSFLKEGGWKTTFMFIVFVGIILIFMDALDWLNKLKDFLSDHWNTSWVSSIILLILIILFMIYVTQDKKPAAAPKKEE